jgi:hypothetical protein
VDAIETAIRNAFAKGDPSDRAFREKVYRSAFAALERALQANPNLPPEQAELRRRSLSARISDIETEFLPAVPTIDPVAPATQGAASVQAPEPVFEPREERASMHSPSLDPVLDPVLDRPEIVPDRPVERDDRLEDQIDPGMARRGRGPWRLIVFVVFLALVAVAAWIAWTALATAPAPQGPAEPDTVGEVPAPQPEAPMIPGQVEGLENWIAVFDPADPTTISAPGDASADVLDDEGEIFARLRSGSTGSAILFDVGQGVLEQLAGRRAVFAVVARAQEGEETQISVDCNFGELGDCGRKRYLVGITREEFLFEVELPAGNPGSGGTIAINSDVEGQGRAVDLFAIRVSTAQ